MKKNNIYFKLLPAVLTGTLLLLPLSANAAEADQTGEQLSMTTESEEVDSTALEEQASVVFNEDELYIRTNIEQELLLEVNCGSKPGFYNIVLVYDDSRMEYVSGATRTGNGKIVVSGQASEQSFTIPITFKTLCNGNAGIYVKNAYILNDDGSDSFKITEKGKTVIAIVGAETTDAEEFSFEQDNRFFFADTEIPLVGSVFYKDGQELYIVDLSCYMPENVEFQYTLAGDIYDDILITMLYSTDESVRLLYLMDEEENLSLYAYNEGKFYPVQKNGNNYYVSVYAISRWPDGLTDEIVAHENVFFILNETGLGAFAKYYNGEIVSWDYKSEIEIVSTEEEEPFYDFTEEGNITPYSIWKGFTSHIEISLLILIALWGTIRVITGIIHRSKGGRKASLYKKNLPPEISYDESLILTERKVREAQLAELRNNRLAGKEEIQRMADIINSETELIPESEADHKTVFMEEPGENLKPEFKTGSDTGTEPELNPESELKPESEHKPESELKPESEHKPESELNPESELKPESVHKPESEHQPISQKKKLKKKKKPAEGADTGESGKKSVRVKPKEEVSDRKADEDSKKKVIKKKVVKKQRPVESSESTPLIDKDKVREENRESRERKSGAATKKAPVRKPIANTENEPVKANAKKKEKASDSAITSMKTSSENKRKVQKKAPAEKDLIAQLDGKVNVRLKRVESTDSSYNNLRASFTSDLKSAMEELDKIIDDI